MQYRRGHAAIGSECGELRMADIIGNRYKYLCASLHSPRLCAGKTILASTNLPARLRAAEVHIRSSDSVARVTVLLAQRRRVNPETQRGCNLATLPHSRNALRTKQLLAKMAI